MYTSGLKTHQKINKAAYASLKNNFSMKHFPDIDLILHFEGKNGPDGIKRKSPSVDEPWHFYDPFDPYDTKLLETITEHYENLVKELKDGNLERAAFEASWLAHALVDGLTPAHHFPYEEELIRMQGKGNSGRKTVLAKLVIKGETRTETIKHNWKYLGSKGLLSTHMFFEGGVAVLAAVRRFKPRKLTKEEILKARNLGLEEIFMRAARTVASYDMYEQFYKRGWTVSLARQVNEELLPEVVEIVTMAWANALHESGFAGAMRS